MDSPKNCTAFDEWVKGVIAEIKREHAAEEPLQETRMDEKRVHELKTWPLFYSALLSGAKTFEVRKNDRDFQNGDKLLLREWSSTEGYSGRQMLREITYMFINSPWLQDGYAVLGLRAKEPGSAGPIIPEIRTDHYAKRFASLADLKTRFGAMRPKDSITLEITDLETLRLLIGMYQEAVAIQGDEEVLKYVTSGNSVPVTRCTVSADLVRQLLSRRIQSSKEPGGVGTVCPNCKGTGKVMVNSFSKPRHDIEKSCGICKGRGTLPQDRYAEGWAACREAAAQVIRDEIDILRKYDSTGDMSSERGALITMELAIRAIQPPKE